VKVLSFLDKYFEEIVCATTFLVFVVLSNVQVIGRYLLPADLAISWTEEIARYLFVWCMFIGISWCIRENSHLRVDMINLVISKKASRVLDILISVAITLFTLIIGYYGYKAFMKQFVFGQVLSASGLPMWLVYLVLPVSALLVIYRSLQRVYSLARSKQGV